MMDFDRSTFRGALLTGTAMLFLAPAAHAQEAAPSVAAQTPGEIVVTAQKRSERLLDTPQSVTALSSDQLDAIAARKFVDFADSVPGLQFTTQGAGTAQISMRGVTSGADVSPTVSIYVDDVPYGSSSAFANGARRALDVGLFDIERVEVLRGPQGTLYGASSMGGVLKYVTRAPSLTDFEGSANAGVSTTRHGGTSYDGSAVVNLPLVEDKIAVRASGFYAHDGGYMDNVVAGKDNVDRGKTYGGRVDLLLAPTEDLSVRLTGFAQNIRRDGSAYADIALDGEPVAGILKQSHPLEEPFASNFRLASATVDYDMGFATLTSITSYQTNAARVRTDGSAVYAPLLNMFFGLPASAFAVDELARTRKFTQEVRLASPTGQKLEWLLGGYYTHEKSLLAQDGVTYDATLTPIDVNVVSARIRSKYQEYAVFGDVTYHFTDRFDVTGGIRYAHNDQAFEQDATGLLVAAAPGQKSKEGVVTYLANARYHFSRDVTAYARFATGYRPGGPNFQVIDAATGNLASPASFDSDSLDSYEGGIKAETADKTFGIDLSGYYIDWKDIQLLTAVQGVTTYVNGGDAHIKGAELTLTARPVAGFVATGAFAYNDGKLTAANAILGAAKGERLPNAPHFTASINVDYTVLDTDLKPSLGLSLRYVSDRTVSFDASASQPQYKLPDYAVLDLRAGLSFGRVDARVYVKNLLDTRAQLSGQTILSSLGGPAQVTILRPRTFGIDLSTRF
ncbi:TonB-dependent receptor [Novosphingobium sp. BL-52-GroH]|uniref:TonB-dependent receptor n=1 Tax=Novosphingobium sp. BL-52-GroH TaxID=3349877 RepID=UPI00384CEE90